VIGSFTSPGSHKHKSQIDSSLNPHRDGRSSLAYCSSQLTEHLQSAEQKSIPIVVVGIIVVVVIISASVDDAVVFKISAMVVCSVEVFEVVPSTRLPGVVPLTASAVLTTPSVVSVTADEVVLSTGMLLVVLETAGVVPSTPAVVSSTLGTDVVASEVFEVVDAAVEVVVSGSFGLGVFVVNLVAAVVVDAHWSLEGQVAHNPFTLIAFTSLQIHDSVHISCSTHSSCSPSHPSLQVHSSLQTTGDDVVDDVTVAVVSVTSLVVNSDDIVETIVDMNEVVSCAAGTEVVLSEDPGVVPSVGVPGVVPSDTTEPGVVPSAGAEVVLSTGAEVVLDTEIGVVGSKAEVVVGASTQLQHSLWLF